jgi:hypothetical protein
VWYTGGASARILSFSLAKGAVLRDRPFHLCAEHVRATREMQEVELASAVVKVACSSHRAAQDLARTSELNCEVGSTRIAVYEGRTYPAVTGKAGDSLPMPIVS